MRWASPKKKGKKTMRKYNLDLMPSPYPWRLVRSKMEKHKEALFIMDGANGFVAKAYGHGGEPVEDNAKLICLAPRMVKLIAQTADNLNVTLKLTEPLEMHYHLEIIKSRLRTIDLLV